jgi:hypothetical protein
LRDAKFELNELEVLLDVADKECVKYEPPLAFTSTSSELESFYHFQNLAETLESEKILQNRAESLRIHRNFENPQNRTESSKSNRISSQDSESRTP